MFPPTLLSSAVREIEVDISNRLSLKVQAILGSTVDNYPHFLFHGHQVHHVVHNVKIDASLSLFLSRGYHRLKAVSWSPSVA